MHAEWLRRAVATYADLLPVEGDGESWNDVITTGKRWPLFKGSDPSRAKGERITESDLDEMISNFTRWLEMEGPIRVDVQHATAQGLTSEETRLRAEIMGLRKVPRDGEQVLQGLFRWTVRGTKEVSERDWRGFSAEIAPPGLVQDKDTGKPLKGNVLVGGTLTNEPFWTGMQPVQLSELLQAQGDGRGMGPRTGHPLAIDEEGPSMDLKLLSEKLGANVTSEDEIVRLYKDLQARATEADKVPGLEEQVQTLTGERDTAQESAQAESGEVVKLSERLGKMEAKLTAEREHQAITRDVDREAVSPAEAGTADEPGIARRIYRDNVQNYTDSYGARPDKFVTGGGPMGHNVEDKNLNKEDDPDAPKTAHLQTHEDATEWLSEQAAAYCEEHKLKYTTPNVRKYAGTIGDEGTRLLNLMMEG